MMRDGKRTIFAWSQSYRLGRKSKICSAEGEPVRKPSVCSPTRVYDPRLTAHPATAEAAPLGLPASAKPALWGSPPQLKSSPLILTPPPQSPYSYISCDKFPTPNRKAQPKNKGGSLSGSVIRPTQYTGIRPVLSPVIHSPP